MANSLVMGATQPIYFMGGLQLPKAFLSYYALAWVVFGLLVAAGAPVLLPFGAAHVVGVSCLVLNKVDSNKIGQEMLIARWILTIAAFANVAWIMNSIGQIM